jgi:hypothetical protein
MKEILLNAGGFSANFSAQELILLEMTSMHSVSNGKGTGTAGLNFSISQKRDGKMTFHPIRISLRIYSAKK